MTTKRLSMMGAMASPGLRITELDEANNVTATYVQSSGSARQPSRIDMIPSQDAKSLMQKGIDVFLPAGYPNSVSHDYLSYQIYDSLQAFSSSIASMLASRAALTSIGVGDTTASPTAALMLSVFQESVGRLATILFAHRFGTSLEPECKMYRLLADVLNDTGFVLDVLSPLLAKPLRPVILGLAGVLRALCGVAAGSTKASLSAHFALTGNIGELNAKDASQETVIAMLGMWAGTLVVSWVTSPLATWTTLFLLLSIHLETNRRAVMAVSMRTLNRQRATLVFHQLRRGHVPSPVEISAQERIFERGGILRASNDRNLGRCTVGAPLSRFLNAVTTTPNNTTKSLRVQDTSLETLVEMYKDQKYILWQDRSSKPSSRKLFIVLKKGVTAKDALAAWWQALSFASEAGATDALADMGSELGALIQARDAAWDLLLTYEELLKAEGWDLETGALETTAGTRVEIGQ